MKGGFKMYYYCKNSEKKIIHTINCFHIQNTDIENTGWFESLSEAYEYGYRLCKHCNPLFKYYKKEQKSVLDFCRKNGMSIHLSNRSISVTSIKSKWKIVLDKKNKIVLYHKNDFVTDKDYLSEVDGYHLQGDVRKKSIVEYLKYIIEHDSYRRMNPLYIPDKRKTTPPKKGTKRYKKEQEKKARQQHRYAVKTVLDLIDSLHTECGIAV